VNVPKLEADLGIEVYASKSRGIGGTIKHKPEEFIVEEAGAMPSGFCTWAWHDIYPAVTGLRFGGNYPWMKKDGMIYSCCSDGARPVFFKIERLV